jgi:glycosyltransferase involved in cell wall biosynthesis
MSTQQKPEIIFVFPNILGGVAYLNKNIINNTSLKKNSFVKVILTEDKDSQLPLFPDKIFADEIIRFTYSFTENRYSVLKRFHALLGTNEGAVICNDGLEMEAIYLYGTNKTVFQFIHDFYNIKLAVKFGAITDVFIAHSKLFRDVILSTDPASVQSFHLDHGVTITDLKKNKNVSDQLKIVFTGRLVESKGVQELFLINTILKNRNIAVQWTIIGRGPLDNFLHDQWKDEVNINFASPDTSEEVLKLMAAHDIFILPTRFEGSPVTVLEALSCGAVPLVSDLPGGISEIITDNIGKRIPIGNINLFAEAIIYFNNNREILHEMSVDCRLLAEKKFDIRNTSDNYFALFTEYKKYKKEQKQRMPLQVGFRLDKKWLPNFFVQFLRGLRKKQFEPTS